MASSNQDPDATNAIKASAHAKLVKLLYDQTPISIYVSLTIAMLVVYILWDTISQILLIVWLGLIIVFSITRLILVQKFRDKRPGIKEIPTWDRLYLYSLFISSFVWGMAGWIFMPDESPLHQAFISFILIGMAGGTVGSFNVRFNAVFIMEMMLLVPMTIWFLFHENSVYKAMTFCVLIFMVATLKAAKKFEERIVESFRLGIELEQAHEREKIISHTDDLTKLHNRRSFFEIGEQAFKTAKRYNQSLSLVMLDIDKFKQINDNYGHVAGDQALSKLAENIIENVRTVDIVGRFGGDEFSILLPFSSVNVILHQLERLRQVIAEQVVSYNEHEIVFTCSFGIAEINSETPALEDLIVRADNALYLAKDKGGNCIVVSSEAGNQSR